MGNQDHAGKDLDKDLRILGNKIYSPTACMFVTQEINKFTSDGGAYPGRYLIGVCSRKRGGKFYAQLSWSQGKREYLGAFATELEAHCCWARAKRERAYELAAGQTDERVAQALRNFGDRVVANADAMRQAS